MIKKLINRLIIIKRKKELEDLKWEQFENYFK